MASCIVVGSIFLASDELLRMEELAIGSSPHFIDNSRLQVNKYCSRNVLASSSLRKESVEGVVSCPNGFVRWHLPIRLNSMLQAVEFPTGIANLATSLANMDGNTLSLKINGIYKELRSLVHDSYAYHDCW